MPGLQKVKGLLDTRRQNLLALGLERRAKDSDKDMVVLKDFSAPRPSDNGTGTAQETVT